MTKYVFKKPQLNALVIMDEYFLFPGPVFPAVENRRFVAIVPLL
jgi:hypothetical protein